MIRIIRTQKTHEGTLGLMYIGGVFRFFTLEPPDKENEPEVSCIPVGKYKCVRVVSPKFGKTFAVTGVPNRTNILFHAGNTASDTHGCILLGMEFRGMTLYRSKQAIAEFLGFLSVIDSFDLEIIDETSKSS